MSERVAVWSSGFCGGLLAIALTIGSGQSAHVPAAEDAKQEAKDLFGAGKVWTIQLDLSAAEYLAMQPAPPAFPGGPPQPKDKKDKRPTQQNRFGTAFPWVEGNVAVNGTPLKKVGIRYAGDITYFVSTRGLKRPLCIQFDRFGNRQLHGLKSVQLHAMPLDPSRAREALAFAVFRSAGVPGPRTAFAEVTLTVPGKYDKEYLGLYTFIEQVDRTFLKDRFKNGKGLLMKPEGIRGLEYLGDDWDKYKARYRPKHEPTKKEAQRL